MADNVIEIVLRAVDSGLTDALKNAIGGVSGLQGGTLNLVTAFEKWNIVEKVAEEGVRALIGTFKEVSD